MRVGAFVWQGQRGGCALPTWACRIFLRPGWLQGSARLALGQVSLY